MPRFAGADKRGDVCLVAVKGDFAGRVNLNLAYADSCLGIEDFDLVTAVDHDIEAVAIDGDVVAYVAEFQHLVGIVFRVYVAVICAGSVVVIVERTLVGSHVAFVEQVEAAIVAAVTSLVGAYYDSVGTENPGVVVRAGCKGKSSKGEDTVFQKFHIYINLRVKILIKGNIKT